MRLINIDKPEGLWNDEYVSWMISAIPFGKGFFEGILKQCHMPLYYFYLKPFVYMNDVCLRFTSILPSLLSIPVMYLVGKEFSKKNGYICALLTSILPFLVYYAQEVRFYSLLFFESALLLLFLIKIINNKKGWIGYSIVSILILLTHVLGWIYLFCTFSYIVYKKRTLSKLMGFLLISSVLILLPFGLNIIKMIPSSQWWGSFSYTNILFLFTDYLSPILTNHVNAPRIFFYNKELLFIIFITIPTLIGLYFIFKGGKYARGLASVIVLTIIATALLACTGKIVFVTKYTIEILPILILLFALGVQNKFDKILLSIFIFLQLFSVFTPYYSVKHFKPEGHKLVADILKKIKNDKIVFTYYEPNRFYRYYEPKSETISIDKSERFNFLKTPNLLLNKIKTGDIVSFVILDSVSFIPKNLIQIAEENKNPEMFVTFSKIKILLMNELTKNYRNHKVERKGSWTVITATKK
ncbi:glycosyltransferase family 39 protein [bacterium]|nr:glycosyltransferase family 39 protein [bacterium]